MYLFPKWILLIPIKGLPISKLPRYYKTIKNLITDFHLQERFYLNHNTELRARALLVPLLRQPWSTTWVRLSLF